MSAARSGRSPYRPMPNTGPHGPGASEFREVWGANPSHSGLGLRTREESGGTGEAGVRVARRAEGRGRCLRGRGTGRGKAALVDRPGYLPGRSGRLTGHEFERGDGQRGERTSRWRERRAAGSSPRSRGSISIGERHFPTVDELPAMRRLRGLGGEELEASVTSEALTRLGWDLSVIQEAEPDESDLGPDA